MCRTSWQAQLLAVSIVLCLRLNYHRCNGQEGCQRRSGCCSDITSDAMDGCVCVNGDVVIDLYKQTNLTQSDFKFLNCLENVMGMFSLVNVHLLSSQIVIPCLQHIGGNDSDIALSVLNVSGGDIIFPKLAVITRGDAEFDIDNGGGVCGFRGINWMEILANGTLIHDNSRCDSNGPNCGTCQNNRCWSQQYCQFNRNGDESLLDMIKDLGTKILIGIGAAIVVVLLLCLCCCCICCYCCCCKKQNKYTTSMTAVRMEDTIDTGVIRHQSQNAFELPSLKIVSELMDPPKLGKISVIPASALEQTQLIGNGSCGQVYKGHWHTDTDRVSYLVAIKVFGTPLKNYRELINMKLDKFSALEHENVLRLCGVSLDTQLMLAYEYAPYNLRQYLMMNKLTLSAKDLISLSTQIAKGMAYLSSKGLSHGNLAARNIMIQQASTAKITDYNLYDLTVQSDWIPVRWLAPETLKYRKCNEKSDMWSYGVTLWEIMTFGAQPYHGKPISDILKALECNERLPQPVTVTADLHSILVGCWWLDPVMRPTFNEMVKNFTTIQSNPSQYVLTMVDGKLDTYLKLPPAISDVSPFENLSEIEGASYLKMLPVGSVPSSPTNALEVPRNKTGTLESISSSSIMEDGTMVTTFMSKDIKAKDEQYEEMTAVQTEDIIYANPDQDEIDANDDDVYVNDEDDTYVNEDDKKEAETEELYSSADQLTEDEVYINPAPIKEELYDDVGPSDIPELYVDPATMTKHDNQDGSYVNDTKPEDELYVTPEHMDNNEDEMYVVPSSQSDDQTALLDHEGRGYEKMKKGVSINDINAEYVYATKDDPIKLAVNASTTTEDGYQIMKSEQNRKSAAPQQPVADEEYVEVMPKTIGEGGYRESQIYSSVQ